MASKPTLKMTSNKTKKRVKMLKTEDNLDVVVGRVGSTPRGATMQWKQRRKQARLANCDDAERVERNVQRNGNVERRLQKKKLVGFLVFS